MNILLGYVLTFGWIGVVFAVSLLVKNKLHTSDEVSRKIVHICVSFSWVFMYLCFGITWHLLVPPAIFIVVNYISYKSDILPMMERDEKDASSLGTVYYAVSLFIMATLSLIDERFILPYGVGIFCMAFADGLAPYFGSIKKGNFEIIRGKRSFYGCLSVFCVSFLVTAAMILIFSVPIGWGEAALVACGAMIFEMIGLKGFDNITLPIGTALLTWLFIVF